MIERRLEIANKIDTYLELLELFYDEHNIADDEDIPEGLDTSVLEQAYKEIVGEIAEYVRGNDDTKASGC